MYGRERIPFSNEEPEEHITIDVAPRAASFVTRLRQALARGDPKTRNLLVILFAVAMLGIVAMGLYGMSLILNEGGPRPPAGGTPVGTPIAGEQLIVSSGPNATIQPAQPLTLTVKGQDLPVYTVLAGQNGEWPYNPKLSSQAAWVYGSLINYLFGLDAANKANVELLASLSEGDRIVVHLSNGAALSFRYVTQTRVPAGDRSLFQQTAPAVTLVLLHEPGDTRLVVQGVYEAETEVGTGSPTATGLGTPVQAGPVRVTALSGDLKRGPLPNLPQGFAYYLVTFEAENTGDAALDTSQFQIALEDGSGGRYDLSLPASKQGTVLPPLLQPGQPVTATAGFLVPESLLGPKLTWEFRAVPGSAEVARVQIPFQAAPATPAPQVQVLITGAGAGAQANTIVVRGLLRNPGQSRLTVNPSDIVLAPAGEAETVNLLSADPAMPWTVEPGRDLQFSLTFARPASDTAMLSLLGYRFQLTRIR